jgi:hypothetical protein
MIDDDHEADLLHEAGQLRRQVEAAEVRLDDLGDDASLDDHLDAEVAIERFLATTNALDAYRAAKRN